MTKEKRLFKVELEMSNTTCWSLMFASENDTINCFKEISDLISKNQDKVITIPHYEKSIHCDEYPITINTRHFSDLTINKVK